MSAELLENPLVEKSTRRVALPVVPNAEAAAVCRECGGGCCKSMPGIAAPEDFGAPDLDVMRERISAALATGRWAIDWWEGDPTDGDLDCVEYIRPAVMMHEGRLRHPSWGGRCTFLGPSGCTLQHDDRPHNCRALVPNPEFKTESCVMPPGLQKQDYAIAWMPYADLLGDMQVHRTTQAQPILK